ncbi:hypothetical protein BGV57_02975 [Burkholderia ubonensis]|uniref:hypothetical protein n=1 Tax=Burkholderia ubonensis TaxID=101571 RepID=UPI0008FDD4FF|nr:hypothetical protein [Burkholderia ubonensis]OJB45850.1 hypothetical protein BGV57_02975 [Burkholderia ubonensis]
MKSENLYGDHLSSLLRFCADQATSLQASTGISLQPVFFDSYNDYDKLPSGNLIGVAQYSLDFDEHLTTVSAVVGVATENDTNDFNLTRVMSALVQRLLPTKSIDVLDALKGNKLGTMVVQNGVRVLPVGGGLGRSMKWVAFMASSTVTADLSS